MLWFCGRFPSLLPKLSSAKATGMLNATADTVGAEEFGATANKVTAEEFTSTAPPGPEQASKLAAGFTLAGQPLEPPRFHERCHQWRQYQRFREADDPDRTGEPWQTPCFALRSALGQRAKTSVHEVEVPEGAAGFCGDCFARVVNGALDEEHCADLIRLCNEKGFTPALLNMGGGQQMLSPGDRDGFRVINDDDVFTDYLFEVLRPYIPEVFQHARAVGLNGRCRYLCYTPGQAFPAHFDGRYTDRAGCFSQVTVQVYLHDVPDANGGATTFLFNDGTQLPCQPCAGSVLLFSQNLEHEGSLVKSGLKYTLRTEVMYTKD